MAGQRRHSHAGPVSDTAVRNHLSNQHGFPRAWNMSSKGAQKVHAVAHKLMAQATNDGNGNNGNGSGDQSVNDATDTADNPDIGSVTSTGTNWIVGRNPQYPPKKKVQTAKRLRKTARTPEASTVPEPFGRPGGPGLWQHKGWQLPPYIQHVAHHLVAQGRPRSMAIGMAVGIVRNWAEGRTGGGGRVHADVQAAAAKNIAKWEALKAAANRGKRAVAGAAVGKQATDGDDDGDTDSDNTDDFDQKSGVAHVFQPLAVDKKRCKICGKPKADHPDTPVPIRPFAIQVGKIAKADPDHQNVYGWAYITHDKDGKLDVDHSGQFVDDPEALEDAVYNFVLKSRTGDVQHDMVVKSTLIESMVFTPEKIEKMGLSGAVPSGWWCGFHVDDPEVFRDVKDGKLSAFSIHGNATKQKVAVARG